MKEIKLAAKFIGYWMLMTEIVGICCIIGREVPSIIGTVVLIVMMSTTEWLSERLFTIIGLSEIYEEVANIYHAAWFSEIIIVASEFVTALIVMGIYRPFQLYFGWSCVIWPVVMAVVLTISFFRLRRIGII